MTHVIDIPVIEPVQMDMCRPSWSVMIPTYNCANYLRQTLVSVLIQDPGPEMMQIEVMDDCSTKDDPEGVVREIGGGRVLFHRQSYNVGPIGNFNTCIRRSRGKWVHILHGDDFVLPGFYKKIGLGLDNDEVGAAFTSFYYVDENGHRIPAQELASKAGILNNWVKQIGEVNLIQCPAIVVKRSTYEHLGGFYPSLIHAADWEMWRRIARNYPYWYDPELLACYREHSASDSSKLIRKGKNLADIRKSINISGRYLDAEITKNALKNYSIYGLRTAERFAQKKDVVAVINQISESIKCNCDYSTIRFIVKKIIPKLI